MIAENESDERVVRTDDPVCSQANVGRRIANADRVRFAVGAIKHITGNICHAVKGIQNSVLWIKCPVADYAKTRDVRKHWRIVILCIGPRENCPLGEVECQAILPKPIPIVPNSILVICSWMDDN